MLSLRNDEKLVIVVRRHWWTLVTPVIVFLVLVIFPTLVAAAGARFQELGVFLDSPLTKLASSVYFLGVLLFAFLLWMEYYLDVWIVTTRRIIDINQQNLFHRVVSEIPLSRVQNVTIDVNGILETFLKFGDVTVETAGETGNFSARNIPLPYALKDAILEHVHFAMELERPIVTTRD